MKNLKIALCALIVLCGCFVFASCGKREKTFDESKISFVNDQVVFNKTAQIFTVKYDGLKDEDLQISYAVETGDGEHDDFKTSLSFTNAGSYKVYYKLSANGYKSFESAEPKTFTIVKKQITPSFADGVDWVKKNGSIEFFSGIPAELKEDESQLPVVFVNSETGEDVSQLVVGEKVVATVRPTEYFQSNYDYGTLPSRTVTVVDNFAVKKGEDVEYLDNFSSAVDLLDEDGVELHLYEDAEIAETLTFSNSVTIVGHGDVSITAAETFDVKANAKEMIRFATENKTLTLQNVRLDGNNTVACIYVNNASLVLNDNARVTRGRVALIDGEDGDANKLTGGVILAGKSNFTMDGGRIYGNHNAFVDDVEFVGETGRYAYASNLWLGTEVNATIKSGSLNNVWVNADATSATRGKLIVDQTEDKELSIENIYLESCSNAEKDAVLEYKNGPTSNKIIIHAEAGDIVMNERHESTTYCASKLFLVDNVDESDVHSYTFYGSLSEAIEHVGEDGVITLYNDVELAQKLDITTSFAIDGNGRTITASAGFGSANVGGKTLKTLFYIAAENDAAKLQISNLTLNGNSLARAISAFAGVVILQDVSISGGADQDQYKSGGLFLTGNAEAIVNNCNISNNSAAEPNTGDENSYQADIWVGANAKLTICADSNVGYIYVNANRYSANNKGYLEVADGNIGHVWLEYYDDFGGELFFVGGTIGDLKVDQAETEVLTIVPEHGNTYCGGVNGAVQPQED